MMDKCPANVLPFFGDLTARQMSHGNGNFFQRTFQQHLYQSVRAGIACIGLYRHLAVFVECACL